MEWFRDRVNFVLQSATRLQLLALFVPQPRELAWEVPDDAPLDAPPAQRQEEETQEEPEQELEAVEVEFQSYTPTEYEAMRGTPSLRWFSIGSEERRQQKTHRNLDEEDSQLQETTLQRGELVTFDDSPVHGTFVNNGRALQMQPHASTEANNYMFPVDVLQEPTPIVPPPPVGPPPEQPSPPADMGPAQMQLEQLLQKFKGSCIIFPSLALFTEDEYSRWSASPEREVLIFIEVSIEDPRQFVAIIPRYVVLQNLQGAMHHTKFGSASGKLRKYEESVWKCTFLHRQLAYFGTQSDGSLPAILHLRAGHLPGESIDSFLSALPDGSVDRFRPSDLSVAQPAQQPLLRRIQRPVSWDGPANDTEKELPELFPSQTNMAIYDYMSTSDHVKAYITNYVQQQAMEPHMPGLTTPVLGPQEVGLHQIPTDLPITRFTPQAWFPEMIPCFTNPISLAIQMTKGALVIVRLREESNRSRNGCKGHGICKRWTVVNYQHTHTHAILDEQAAMFQMWLRIRNMDGVLIRLPNFTPGRATMTWKGSEQYTQDIPPLASYLFHGERFEISWNQEEWDLRCHGSWPSLLCAQLCTGVMAPSCHGVAGLEAAGHEGVYTTPHLAIALSYARTIYFCNDAPLRVILELGCRKQWLVGTCPMQGKQYVYDSRGVVIHKIYFALKPTTNTEEDLNILRLTKTCQC